MIRLLGIYEGIIEQKYLPKGKYRGYQHRIDTLKKQGYVYNDSDLRDWLNLRNAIVHSPPEKFRPVSLIKNDLLGLSNLLKDNLQSLKAQKSATS